jgi:ABC-type transporter Mla subunit MlaD
MERAVGWFVLLATMMLAFGFGYYIYHTAQRKGWFVTKAPYFTFSDRATGLKVGDPVVLMGLEVGQITRMVPQPPDDIYYNIYVELEIKAPFYGYLWSEGSRAKINSADFLGKRQLEVTKGTNGCPTYLFNPIRVLTPAEARNLPDLERWTLGEDIYDSSVPRVAVPALTPLSASNLTVIASLGATNLVVIDTREQRKQMTAVWSRKAGGYLPYVRGVTKPYWLHSDESPAVTERLEKLVAQVERALPDFLGLTNQLLTVLSNSASLTSKLDAVALSTLPAVSNLTTITAQLRERGSLGEWLVPSNVWNQLEATLGAADKTFGNADVAILNADTNLAALIENLGRSLNNLADITSNLNLQVQANTNILGDISAAIVHTDDLVQGLKRHWLLRSAFRGKTSATPTNSTPQQLTSPKEKSQR